jgi:outer membrane protein assembly factor BamB
MATPNLVFIGIRGSVVAIDKPSGARRWETKLKGISFVSLLVDNDRVFAGANGEVFCLDAATGKILWRDGLRGYGFGLLSIAVQNQGTDSAVLAAEHDRQQSDASSSAGVAAASS